jgi:hypothetical protein
MAGQGHIRQGRVCRKCGGTERNANGQCAEGAAVLITKPMATRCASTTAHAANLEKGRERRRANREKERERRRAYYAANL